MCYLKKEKKGKKKKKKETMEHTITKTMGRWAFHKYLKYYH